MNQDILFNILTLIVIFAIIILFSNITTAIIVIGLLANALTINSRLVKIIKDDDNAAEETADTIAAAVPEDIEEITAPTERFVDVNKEEYKKWSAYKESYVGNYDAGNMMNSADNRYITVSKARQRDKQAMDGALVKDSNYYKYHFGTELEDEENKPWWGRQDF